MAFIQISNSIFRGEESMDSKGFFVYSFIQIIARGEKGYFNFRMNDFIGTVNNGINDIESPRLSDKRSLSKVLDSLVEDGYIEVRNNIKFSDIKVNDMVFIKIKHIATNEIGYEQLDVELFLDMAKSLGYIGYSIYTYLCFRFNSNDGYAYPSKTEMSEYMNSSRNTVSEYCKIMVDLGLLSIKSNSKDNKVKAHLGDFDGMKSDEYTVFSRIKGKKYNVCSST